MLRIRLLYLGQHLRAAVPTGGNLCELDVIPVSGECGGLPCLCEPCSAGAGDGSRESGIPAGDALESAEGDWIEEEKCIWDSAAWNTFVLFLIHTH